MDNTLGQAKVWALQQRSAHIHPACRVHLVEEFVDANNWPSLLDGPVDAVIDACDQVRAKTVMAAWARAQRVGFVSVGAAGGKRWAHEVTVDDLARTTHDPLLAQLRYRLRREHAAPRDGAAMDVACVFSREAVRPPDPSCAIDDSATGDGTLNCHGTVRLSP